jgi:hypothetical protein
MTRTLRRLAVLVVIVGVVWRLTRYLLRFPVWGDEAMLLVNYPGKGYLDVTGPLEHCQVAPLLFHWVELTALRLFGASELAVRLPALLACLGSLVLFWWLARWMLPPTARWLAVAVLSVSIWPATLGSLVKPYTFDLFFSLALLLAGVAVYRRPEPRRLLVLALVIPVALLASYPAVFVAGAVSLALLPVVCRQKRSVLWMTYLLCNVLILTTFAGHYHLVARAQLDSSPDGTSTAAFMADYWQHGFPPAEPLALMKWLVFAHTGQMAAYPIGAAAGGSVVTVLLCLRGVARLWRRRRWLIGLFAAVFALGLIAAVLRGYPYGASCRLAQHLAPMYCLLAGAGLSALLAGRRAMIAVLVGLALLGVGGIARDFLKPYRDEESLWAARLVRELETRAGEEPILVTKPDDLAPVLRWQLLRRGERVLWRADDVDSSSVWVIGVEAGALPGWRCVERSESTLRPARRDDPMRRAVVERWRRDE